MKIVVDAMGGDFAPKVNVDGAIDALREYPDMDIILVGRRHWWRRRFRPMATRRHWAGCASA